MTCPDCIRLTPGPVPPPRVPSDTSRLWRARLRASGVVVVVDLVSPEPWPLVTLVAPAGWLTAERFDWLARRGCELREAVLDEVGEIDTYPDAWYEEEEAPAAEANAKGEEKNGRQENENPC